jgi:hypothetical protein
MTGNKSAANGHAKASSLGLLAGAFNLACRRIAQPPVLSQLPRVFSEGTAPVRRLIAEARNHEEIRGLLGSGTDVTFISSFFRSGNTWTRFLLADILLQNRGIETSTADSGRISQIVPDIYADFVARRDVTPNEPALVKTHEGFDTVRRCVLGRNGRPAGESNGKGTVRLLYLYRKPEDVLVSFYHFRLLQSPVVGRWVGVESFCRSQFPAWKNHVSSYLEAADYGMEVFFMSYERLLEEPAAALGLMLRWIGIGHTAEKMDRAVANMRFENLRALEDQQSKNNGERFFRNGRSDTGAGELSAESTSWIRESAAPLLARAEERAAVCRSRVGAM